MRLPAAASPIALAVLLPAASASAIAIVLIDLGDGRPVWLPRLSDASLVGGGVAFAVGGVVVAALGAATGFSLYLVRYAPRDGGGRKEAAAAPTVVVAPQELPSPVMGGADAPSPLPPPPASSAEPPLAGATNAGTAVCHCLQRWEWRLAVGRAALVLSLAAAGGLCVAAATNVNCTAHDRGAQVYVLAQVGWLLLTTAVADGGRTAAAPPSSLPPLAVTATFAADRDRTPAVSPPSPIAANGVSTPPLPIPRPRGVLLVQLTAAAATVIAVGGFVAYFTLYPRSLPAGVEAPPPPPGTYVRLGVAFDIFSIAEYVLVAAIAAHAMAVAVLLRGEALVWRPALGSCSRKAGR